jgi:hypothetical protein
MAEPETPVVVDVSRGWLFWNAIATPLSRTMLRIESVQARIVLVAGALSAGIVSLPGPLSAVPINPQASPTTSASASAPSPGGGGPRRPGMILSPATAATAVEGSDGGPRRPGPIHPDAPSLPLALQ